VGRVGFSRVHCYDMILRLLHALSPPLSLSQRLLCFGDSFLQRRRLVSIFAFWVDGKWHGAMFYLQFTTHDGRDGLILGSKSLSYGVLELEMLQMGLFGRFRDVHLIYFELDTACGG